MLVIIENTEKDLATCNFCSKKGEEENRAYAYKQVATFRRDGSGHRLVASICRQCLNELIEKTNILKLE